MSDHPKSGLTAVRLRPKPKQTKELAERSWENNTEVTIENRTIENN